ncbi:uncharacterized protein [Oryza sativa Japonica Group]|uniref:uncharacterized protein isoform X2 n=1 Tax=Oryza sativa subsp. japonica TaxID=39947 RepID=UPI0001C7F73C|nr:uncharacterized protein LOC4324469 isoform X2 [Oryza sativa Japonica Group]KAF2954465.1 hypothetical protein DAI22_01g484900 [Oryza sativa Japonica Group]
MPPPLDPILACMLNLRRATAAAAVDGLWFSFFSTTTTAGGAMEEEKAASPVSRHIMPHLLNMVKQIKSAFYTLPKLFGESKIVEYTITENETAPGKVEILIDNKQHYKFLGRAIDLASLITLDVEDGKVVKHQDWWDKKPLKNRDTVSFPVVGRLAEATRRGAMLLTHALMGCGKDP